MWLLLGTLGAALLLLRFAAKPAHDVVFPQFLEVE